MISFDAFQALSDPFDRLVAELEATFEIGDCDDLAQCIVEAEEADFHWQARLAERCLGSYFGAVEEHLKLERVAIIGRLKARWFAACCLVDGSGAVEELLWLRRCEGPCEAREAFWSAR